MEEYMKNIKEPENGLKVETYTIMPSNPYGSQPDHIFAYMKELCEKHTVVDIKYIEGKKDITYVIVAYKE